MQSMQVSSSCVHCITWHGIALHCIPLHASAHPINRLLNFIAAVRRWLGVPCAAEAATDDIHNTSSGPIAATTRRSLQPAPLPPPLTPRRPFLLTPGEEEAVSERLFWASLVTTTATGPDAALKQLTMFPEQDAHLHTGVVRVESCASEPCSATRSSLHSSGNTLTFGGDSSAAIRSGVRLWGPSNGHGKRSRQSSCQSRGFGPILCLSLWAHPRAFPRLYNNTQRR